jgi:phosphoribosylformylglycinamidine synthase
MWQFIRGVEGIRDAAIALETPVVSGNVSFYNETEGRAIPPTPTIAMLGVLEDARRRVTQFFKREGDAIILLRTAPAALAASEYAALFGSSGGSLAPLDLKRERALIEGLVAAADRGLIRSAHDVAEGGLAVTLAECCFNPDGVLGAEIDGMAQWDGAEVFFGEGASAVVLSAAANEVEKLRELFDGIEFSVIGRVTSEPRLRVAKAIDEDVRELRQIHEQAIARRLAANG